MTIAIGVPFEYQDLKCALVCADTKVTATDGATSSGAKVSISLSSRSTSFAIASACEDADAAKMLGEEIMNGLCEKGDNFFNISAVVKEIMTEWHAAYHGGKAPDIQYVLAAGVGEFCGLFFCSPPNTVLRKTGPFAIGSGGRALDPLLPDEQAPTPTMNAAIARAAYWMYRAKQYEGAFCGGETHGFLIAEHGGFGFVVSEELEKLEGKGRDIDLLINNCILKMFSGDQGDAQRLYLDSFNTMYLAFAKHIADCNLADVHYLNNIRRSTSQMSKQEP